MLKFNLERFMQIAQDLKKEFKYSKCEGLWYWHDRGDEENKYGPFDTFHAALSDVVEPYVGSESEEE